MLSSSASTNSTVRLRAIQAKIRSQEAIISANHQAFCDFSWRFLNLPPSSRALTPNQSALSRLKDLIKDQVGDAETLQNHTDEETTGAARPRRDKQKRFPDSCTCDDLDNCNCEHTEAPQRGTPLRRATQIRKEKKRKLELEEKTEAVRAKRQLKATIKRLKSIAKKPSLYPLDIDNLPPPPQRVHVPFLKEYKYNHLLYMAENRTRCSFPSMNSTTWKAYLKEKYKMKWGPGKIGKRENKMMYKTKSSKPRTKSRSEKVIYQGMSTSYNEGMKNLNYEWSTMIGYLKSMGVPGGILEGFDPPFMTAKMAGDFLNSEKNRKRYRDTIIERGQERKKEELGKGPVEITYNDGDGTTFTEKFNRNKKIEDYKQPIMIKLQEKMTESNCASKGNRLARLGLGDVFEVDQNEIDFTMTGDIWININSGGVKDKTVLFEEGGWQEIEEPPVSIHRYSVFLDCFDYKASKSQVGRRRAGMKSFALARLVYAAAFPKEAPLCQMEHADQNWKNNDLCNLCSCTKTFNVMQENQKLSSHIFYK
ncbi:hypothetical protein TrCOL_g67 [Triparma columacea]|uniref:Uncharacterized protein n=1 Tax=Triparma columacea TaxID=722753 RepID=A0A9W7G8X1_9STRA|nr:hypothetical protein TrCOL_g67 [Triparma columacea]